MLDLHRLRLLRELSHRGTLAAVAEALSYSPSAISQQLAQLEHETGVPLLEKAGRRVRLTEQAEILVRHTETVLGQLERAEADLAASLREVTGLLRVAAFQTAALTLVPNAVTALARSHPGLRLRIRQIDPEQAIPTLTARDYDVVLGEEYPGQPQPRVPGVSLHRLGRDPLRLAVPDSFDAADLADLASAPWAMEPSGTSPRRWAQTVCRTAGFEPDIRFESTDMVFHASLVATGHAASLLPDLVWAATPIPGRLLTLPGSPARTLFMAVREGAHDHPAITAFHTALRTSLTTLKTTLPLPTTEADPAS
ncbi:LysR family transcriptional regulator [Actinocorallia sp. API 0066]|uniref:LysR family transcriptional regulator n=1 Tax=Actinocorallia sp. API 0066 TaxID=2896846 RepID=UPI001E37F880|nr:LysR substrate-binding domain-containing protein [Actinocorallia sp. API 0066]MCD0449771.1 LysR family transcriptional regulator [Actinocorallia sp. API 0066]